MNAKTILNIALIIGIVISAYFVYLSLTPEGYTGIFIFFQYSVNSTQNPAIVLGLFIAAFLAMNWKNFWRSSARFQLAGLLLAGAAIIFGVFFFLNFKRHNRLPWQRPNVVTIVVDTLRADHISAYNTEFASTPNIDALAEEGWLFENAYSHIPITMPSHSSLFTGRLPSDVWVLNNRDDFTYPEQTLAEIFKEHGYKTAAAISLGVLKANFKLGRGFDHYNDQLPKDGRWFNLANVITDRGIEWLDENVADDDNFFLWLHYSDPHEPYDPPGSPADTGISLNGEQIKSGVLDSAARIDAEITLKPGRNEIKISRLIPENITQYLLFCYFTGPTLANGPFPQEWRPILEDAARESRPAFRREFRLLQSEAFLGRFRDLSFGNLVFNEGPGWMPPDYGANRTRRNLTREATIYVDNNSGEPMQLTFHIKGGLYKPLSMVKDLYAKEVEFADREIGRFLNYLRHRNLMDNTIIVFLSDHGEELGEHGLVGHIHNLYTQSLHVPLIIRDPNTDHKSRKISGVARLIDIAPTVLDMAGIRIPEYMQGRTLMEYLLRNRSEPRELYSQTFLPEANDNKFGILDEDQLGIYLPDAERIRRFELFDLEKDPIQWRNLALSEGSANLNEFATKARRYSESVTIDKGARVIETEREEMLRDLGYITGNQTPALLQDIGEPTQEMIDAVQENAAKALESYGVSDIAVERRDLGSGAEAFPYIALEITLPSEHTFDLIRNIHGAIDHSVARHSRQFPLRFIAKGAEKVVVDHVFAGDTRVIVDLYTSRLLRVLMHQPFSFSLSSTYENLFPVVSRRMESIVGADSSGN